ncbi:MAG: iron(III) transport system ATP-binding protein [Halioglobus sp.]|jgi:iron(III) transport system ATP-binding protein
MTAQLELSNVQVTYGAVQAVRDISLTLAKGEIGCLLGPSGCGKTSLLRAIAGFETVAAGEVCINGNTMSSASLTTPPELRKVGMVFQDFALFPHLNTQRNIAFGLSAMSREEKKARVMQLLDLVGLTGYEQAYPHELSGGQQQRVALARAMAPAPEVLLLDEPFSGLDSELREQLAGEIRQILKDSDVTAILVTHDQHEAFAMADTVALLCEGEIAQIDTPYNLYHNPADEFVARFIGQGSIIDVSAHENGELSNGMGVLDRKYHQWKSGETLRLLVRPDDVKYEAKSELQLKVGSRSFRGAEYLYELELPCGATVPCMTASHVDYAPGQMLPVKFDLQHLVIFQNNNHSL